MSNKLELYNQYINEIKTHFQNQYQCKMDSEFIENTLKSFNKLNSRQQHTITLSLKGFLFYAYLEVDDLDTDAKFTGNSGGLGLGLSVADGSLYTASGFSFADIYKQTVSFQVNSSPAYFNVNFFNSKREILGHVQAASIGLGFVDGGKGKWKTKS